MSPEGLAFHLISVHKDPLAITRGFCDNSMRHAWFHVMLHHRRHALESVFWGDEAVEEVLEDYEGRTLPGI